MTFRSPGTPTEPSKASAETEDRVPVYQLALDFASQLYTIIELSESVERFFLRDTLDKKSTVIPVIISRALGTKDMSERREQYRIAHRAVTDCAAILDVLQQRGTVEPEVLDGARATAAALVAKLDRLGDRWRETEYR